MTTVIRRSLRSSTSTLDSLPQHHHHDHHHHQQHPFNIDIQHLPPTYLKGLDLGMPATRGKGGGKRAKQPLAQVPSSSDGFSSDVRAKPKANGKKGKTGKSKRKAPDYEDEDDGFQFSRAVPPAKKARPSLDGDYDIPQSSEGSMPPPKKPAKKGTKKGGSAAGTSRKKGDAVSSTSQLSAELPERPANGRTLRRHPREAATAAAAQSQSYQESQPRQQQSLPPPQPPSEPSRTATTTTKTKSKSTRSTRKRTASPTAPPPPSRIPQPPTLSRSKQQQLRSSSPRQQQQHTPMQAMANITIEPTPQKIALPFADTPVMRKNKEMRMKNNKKAGGQRRSSLGMRGRRASSLIDSGASNALPHDEVRTEEFYKHIEGEGLPEPRRMRQLLTWCATRAIAQKPVVESPDDQGALLVARVIQDEILKEFSIRSELSDWFSREDADFAAAAAVVRKPNPKNEQNSEKIRELEAQIERLRKERETLRSLMVNAPVIPEVYTPKKESGDDDHGGESTASTPSLSKVDVSLLDPVQQQILTSLSLPPLPSSSSIPPEPTSTHPDPANPSLETHTQQPDSTTTTTTELDTSIASITARLSRLTNSLVPTIDSFAHGIHNIELYRSVADDTAGKVLSICARRLEARDRARRLAARRKAGIEVEEGDGEDGEDEEEVERGRRDDVVAVLAALSRVER